MIKLGCKFPNYKWDKNFGYGHFATPEGFKKIWCN